MANATHGETVNRALHKIGVIDYVTDFDYDIDVEEIITPGIRKKRAQYDNKISDREADAIRKSDGMEEVFEIST